jgi:hypothetical protein
VQYFGVSEQQIFTFLARRCKSDPNVVPTNGDAIAAPTT